jgi:hypothetical protein
MYRETTVAHLSGYVIKAAPFRPFLNSLSFFYVGNTEARLWASLFHAAPSHFHVLFGG